MLNKVLKNAKTIAIGGHVRPDGDCVGSCMGMYLYIQKYFPEKTVDVYLRDIPESLKILDGMENIRSEINEEDVYDLFICQDCGDKGRLDFSAPLYDNAKHTFCIDHHISNQEFAELNYIVPEASSTSELVYNLFDKAKITKEIAEALYLGIVHDTGVFQYSCAAPSTFRAAADLLEKGIDAPKMIRETYYEKTFAQNKILAYTLLKSWLLLDGKCIASYLTQEELEKYQVSKKDMDGIVAQLRNTTGIEAAIFLYQLSDGEFKVSLRSNDIVDVSIIAQKFGGGGHRRAAGFGMSGDPEKSIAMIAEQIGLQLGCES